MARNEPFENFNAPVDRRLRQVVDRDFYSCPAELREACRDIVGMPTEPWGMHGPLTEAPLEPDLDGAKIAEETLLEATSNA
jgi:hypothetical protein